MKPRQPTRKERQQLICYIRRLTDEDYQFARSKVAECHIAVFDDYIMRCYQGRLMVAVNMECIVEVFIWGKNGQLKSVCCSG